VTRVVGQPPGGVTLLLGREADRAADLQDHVRHAGADARQQFVELGQALGALAVLFAHVHVQHGGAGVVAVDRLLDLVLHADRDVLREIRRHPLGTVGRGSDDQLLLVLGIVGTVLEIHDVCPGV
jgi:hypothetical protein